MSYANQTRYHVEWLAYQNIPDGEDYCPDTHDHYDSINLSSEASALRLAEAKQSITGWAKVTKEAKYFDHYNRVYYWDEIQTIRHPE